MLVVVGWGRKMLVLILRLHILIVFITSHAAEIDFYFTMSSRSWLARRRWPRTEKVPTTSRPVAHVWRGPSVSHIQVFERFEAPRLVFLLVIVRLSVLMVVVMTVVGILRVLVDLIWGSHCEERKSSAPETESPQ